MNLKEMREITKRKDSDVFYSDINRLNFEDMAHAKMMALLDLVEVAKRLRIYCLGNDCSTINMLKRFDNAIKSLEQE